MTRAAPPIIIAAICNESPTRRIISSTSRENRRAGKEAYHHDGRSASTSNFAVSISTDGDSAKRPASGAYDGRKNNRQTTKTFFRAHRHPTAPVFFSSRANGPLYVKTKYATGAHRKSLRRSPSTPARHANNPEKRRAIDSSALTLFSTVVADKYEGPRRHRRPGSKKAKTPGVSTAFSTATPRNNFSEKRAPGFQPGGILNGGRPHHDRPGTYAYMLCDRRLGRPSISINPAESLGRRRRDQRNLPSTPPQGNRGFSSATRFVVDRAGAENPRDVFRSSGNPRLVSGGPRCCLSKTLATFTWPRTYALCPRAGRTGVIAIVDVEKKTRRTEAPESNFFLPRTVN